jgi:hypothetical protein
MQGIYIKIILAPTVNKVGEGKEHCSKTQLFPALVSCQITLLVGAGKSCRMVAIVNSVVDSSHTTVSQIPGLFFRLLRTCIAF